MIKRQTTFVLGAGCSLEFGFPTGFGLVRQLSLQDASGTLSQPLAQLIALGFDDNTVRAFSIALSRSGRSSVDAFLEHRTDMLEIGKAAIATALIPKESQDSLFRPDHGSQSLYQYLWECLNAKPRDFYKNRVNFITFNYDRSLEEYLSVALTNAYGLAPYEAAEILSQLTVNHVHGSLGNHPAFYRTETRGYVSDFTESEVRLAASQIKIIHEKVDETPELLRAREALQQSDVVVFLGFGYDSTNLRRLDVKQIPFTANMFGTAFDLTKIERNAVTEQFPAGLMLGGRAETALTFLREHVPLSLDATFG